MTVIERAAAVIAQTEATLRELLALAAQEGDYPTIVRLAAWARTMHELTAGDESVQIITGASTKGGPSRRRPTRGGTKQPIGLRKKDKKYPTFFRTGNELVLLAWSKREKKEYRHKASNSVLQSLAMAIVEKGSGGRVFKIDELLPVRSLANGTEVPKYKAYVGISFLKHFGVIEQHGRSGYSIPGNTEFESTVKKLWDQLPTMD